jgi:hypothetical protein
LASLIIIRIEKCINHKILHGDNFLKKFLSVKSLACAVRAPAVAKDLRSAAVESKKVFTSRNDIPYWNNVKDEALLLGT